MLCKKKTHGFTLIELLVSIAIISVLMGILVPSLARAKAKVRTVLCGTNLRGIHRAMAAYAIDFKDRLPPKYEIKKTILTAKEIAEGKRLNTLTDGIQIVLAPYAGDRVFQCPGDAGSFEDATAVWRRRGVSYDVKGVPPKEYNNSTKAMFWNKMNRKEDIATDVFKPWDAQDAKKVQEKISKGEMGPKLWHNGVVNIVMAEGHVISVKTKEQEHQAKGKTIKE